MPNLAFSPGPQQPPHPQQQVGGEKENASSAPTGGIKSAVDPPPRHRSSGSSGNGSLGRTPLERLSPDPAPAPSAATPALVAAAASADVACKRNSSCKCPDCDMAASAFGIDQLRQIGGGGRGGGGGGVSASPVRSLTSGANGGGASPTAGTPIASPALSDQASPAAHATPASLASATSSAKKLPPVSPPENKGKTVDESPGKSKSKWGFKLARAVFSPGSRMSPKKKSKDDLVVAAAVPVAPAAEVSAESPLARSNSGHDAETPDARRQPPQDSHKGTPPDHRAHSSASPSRQQQASPTIQLTVGNPFNALPQHFPAAVSGVAGKVSEQADADAAPAAPGTVDIGAAATAVQTPGSAIGSSSSSRRHLPADTASLSSGNDADDDGYGGGGGGGDGDLFSDDELAAAQGAEGGPGTDENAVTAAAGAGLGEGGEVSSGMGEVAGGGKGEGGGASRRSVGGRRLSKDVFFECSSEVEHVLASSDSESDNDDQPIEHPQDLDEQQATAATTTAMNQLPPVISPNRHHAAATTTFTPPTAVPTSVTVSPAADDGFSDSLHQQRPAAAISPDPTATAAIEKAVAASASGDTAAAAAAAVEEVVIVTARGPSSLSPSRAALDAQAGAASMEPAAALSTSESDAASATTTASTSSTENLTAFKPQDDGQTQCEEKGVVGAGGRRRNRRQPTKLGLAHEYGLEDSQARFSQTEVDAKIRERVDKEHAAFEKTVAALTVRHEAELQAAAEELKRSSSDGDRAKMAARDTEALEREIAMLSERFGGAAAEARSTGKALREKEALLDAVTAQLMGLKTELAADRAAHAAEKQSIREEADAERRLRSGAEGTLAQLEAAYNRLEDTEREKRAAGILKMKNDMQSLARAQFSEANKKHNAVKARLEAAEAETRQLRETVKTHDSRMRASKKETEDLRCQVETLQSAQAERISESSRRERLLEDEIASLRDEAESRVVEVEGMARERDEANNGRDVSQDALARMAIRNAEMKDTITELEGKVRELEDMCVAALDTLDQEKAAHAATLAAGK